MRRLLFGLLGAGVLCWGYATWFVDDAAAAPDPPATDLTGLISGPSTPPNAAAARLPEKGEDAAAAVDSQPLRAQAGPRDPLAARVGRGDATALADVWRRLAKADPAAPQSELLDAVAAAPRPTDAATAVAALGDNNAFLHSESGRQAARRALELVREEGDASQVRLLTGMVERCMRGDIREGQAQAKALVEEVYAELKKPVLRHLCNPSDLTRARSYQVRPGDSLGRIANKFRKEHGVRLAAGTIAILNRIHNLNAIRVGQTIKIPTDEVVTVLEKRSFLMAVYVGDVILRLYWVGHGADGKTPETDGFTVSEKLERPDWYSPDGVFPYGHPKNILGNYFVKFSHPSFDGFGAHGTTEPDSIGTMASAGCVRMLDADIEEYFRIVPRGSKVIVRSSR